MADPDLEQARLAFRAANFSAAEDFARRVIARDPKNPDALNIAGMCAGNTGRRDEAIELLTRVVMLKPGYVRARSNLALLLIGRGNLVDAEEQARAAIASAPNQPIAHFALGKVLRVANRHGEALAALNCAIDLDANYADAHFEKALLHDEMQQFEETMQSLSRVIALQPDGLRTYAAMATVQQHQGLVEDAIASYRAGQRIAPNDAAFAGYLLLVRMYHPHITAQQLFDEASSWNARFAAPLSKEIRPHENARDPNRVLRIGYVSPNFREHSVAFFFEPILANHDRKKFKIFLYHDVKASDAFTARMRSHGDEWREISGMDDQRVRDLVRADQIDILIDLAQHLQDNRMLVFARKPAPVQVSYLGYPATTGLTTIDYRLSDPYLDPVDAPRVVGTEEIVRLPESYFCYRPPDDAPALVDPPSLRNGFITFASHHSLMKLSEACLAAWARLMHQIPRSRLVIKAMGCTAQSARDRLSRAFETAGVTRDRLSFAGFTSLHRTMEELNDADIALDAFPYSGGTTTCHTLWMGLPVITLAGLLPFQRLGYSVVSQIGLQDLAAKSEDEYVQITVKLANDSARLKELRTGMRDRMKNSPLMRAHQFDRGLETIYREMWKRYCPSKT